MVARLTEAQPGHIGETLPTTGDSGSVPDDMRAPRSTSASRSQGGTPDPPDYRARLRDTLRCSCRDLMALLDASRPCSATAPSPPRFVHGDVQPRIVLVDDAETITTLIDVEVAGGGDPTEEFALVGLDWDAPRSAP